MANGRMAAGADALLVPNRGAVVFWGQRNVVVLETAC